MLLNKLFLIIAFILTNSIFVFSQNKNNFFPQAINFFSINIDSSIYFLKKGIPYYKSQEDWETYVNCYNGLSSCYSIKGDFTKSHSYALKASIEADLYLTESSPSALFAMYNNLANYSREVGDFEISIDLLKRSLNSFEVNKDGEGEVTTLNNIGNCYYLSGDIEESKRYYYKSLDLAKSVLEEYNTNTLNASLGLANLYKSENKIDTALSIYTDILSQLKKNPSKELSVIPMIEIHENIAEILLLKNKEEDFKKNLTALNRLHLNAFKYNSKSSFLLSGEWALKHFRFDKAISDFKSALQIEIVSNKNIKYSTKIGEIHFRIGNVFFKMKEYDSALEYLNLALQHFKVNTYKENKTSLHDAVLGKNTLETLITKATIHFQKFELNQDNIELSNAENNYALAIKLLNKIRRSYVSQGSKENLLKNAKKIFEGMLRVQFHKYKESSSNKLNSSIYEFFENSKAVVLLESVNDNHALGSAGIPDSLIQLEKMYTQNITIHKKELASFEGSDSIKRITIQNNLFDLENSHQELIDTFESQFPKYYELKYNDNFNTLEDGIKLLSNDRSALVNYFVGENDIFTLVITKQNVNFIKTPKPDNFANQIEEIRHLLSQPPNSDTATKDFEHFTFTSNQLYQTLIAPLSLPKSIDQLTIIPDDLLAYIPFDILLSKLPETNKVNYKPTNLQYLIKDYKINYLYSSSLTQEKKSSLEKNSKNIIGFAPNFGNQEVEISDSQNCNLNTLSNLACNTEEVESVSYMLNGKALFGSAANKNQFNNVTNEYRIAHFATHSCLNDENPMLNRIFFADGYISNYDLYNLDLDNEMVVLSACNTGSGTLRRGEGVMSLSRGFIHAGCPSVLMSLWSVEDCTTTDIMVNFYQEIKDGKQKDFAIQAAKLNYLKESNKLESHPFYWAPFVHIGNTEPISFSDKFNYILLLIMLSTVIISFLIYKKWKAS